MNLNILCWSFTICNAVKSACFSFARQKPAKAISDPNRKTHNFDSENNKDNEVITVHIDYNKTDSQEIKFKNEENKKRLLYLLEYIKEEGIYKKIDNIDMTKPNSINMGTKEDINILLNSDEELKYNISRLAMILADLQNKKQKGGEIDLSTGKYALYRP